MQGESFPDTWRRVTTDPEGFFAAMPQTGGLQAPLAFLAICAAIDAAGHLLFGWWLRGPLAVFVTQVIGGFVGAAILTLIAQHLFGGRAGFEATFRVVAYASATSVVAWVPLLGAVAALYGAYLVVRGLERVHGLDTTRAVLTVLLGIVALAFLRLGPLHHHRHRRL